jgi:hypothetical protein
MELEGMIHTLGEGSGVWKLVEWVDMILLLAKLRYIANLL